MRVLMNKQVKEYDDENGNHVQETTYTYGEKPLFDIHRKNGDGKGKFKINVKKALFGVSAVSAVIAAGVMIAGSKDKKSEHHHHSNVNTEYKAFDPQDDQIELTGTGDDPAVLFTEVSADTAANDNAAGVENS